MSVTIIHKKGSGIPSADSLQVAEIAVDVVTGKLYTKTDDGNVVEISGSSGESGGGGFVHVGEAPPSDPQEGQEWLEIPADGDATMWIWDGAKWLQHPSGGSGGGSGDVDLSDYYTKAESEAKFLETESDPTVGDHIKAITPEQIDAWDNPSGGGGMEYDIDQQFTITTADAAAETPPSLIVNQSANQYSPDYPAIEVSGKDSASMRFKVRNADGSEVSNAVFGFNSNTNGRFFSIGKRKLGESSGRDIDLGGSYMFSDNYWFQNCRITGTYTGTTLFTSKSFQNGAPIIDARELVSVLSELRDVTKDAAVTSVDSLKTAMSSKLDSLVDRLTRGIDESRAVDEDAWAYTTMSEEDYNEFMREKYGEPENE